MPRQIALSICIFLILYLFWVDRKNNEGASYALWIPFVWIVLAGSRYLSRWLNLSSIDLSETSYLDGSPIDRTLFLILIAGGIVVLVRRRLNWNELFKKNLWIWLFFLFGAISISWSDFPFISLKRWFKASGNVVMALIILTEARPFAAFGVILRRFAYLLLPLSVLFIKYYPNLGRAYHMGVPMFTGVAMQKNGLGAICLLSGIYFSWNLLLGSNEVKAQGHRLHYSVYLIIVPMIAWLLYMANSATSLACLIVSLCLFVVARKPAIAVKPQRLIYLIIASVVLFGIMELAFDIKNTVIAMLGRRPDLTTRVPMWSDLLTMVKNPLVGFGFEGFWLGFRQQRVFEKWGVLNAHNGYLQMYLDLGYIGLFFIVAWILSGLRNVARELIIDYPVAVLRLCLIIVACLYNWTEAAFDGISNIWILFLLGIMVVPSRLDPDKQIE
jgi:O-antigen ligase